MTTPATVAAHEWSKPVWDIARLWVSPKPTKLPGRDQLPTGVQYQTALQRSDKQNTVTIQNPDVVLDGWNFKAAKCAIKADSSSCIIRNSLIGGEGLHVPLWAGRTVPNSNCVVEDCEIDGLGTNRLFAGIVQVGERDATSSLTLRRCRIFNAPRQTAAQRGKFWADQCWFGGPAVEGKAGDHVSGSHVYGGEAKFTRCLFDGKDAWATAPLNSWTAWLFYEPYAAGQNITGGLIENCILVNPHKDGYYMINAMDLPTIGTTTRNLVVRNNIIQAGKNGKHFYPGYPQCFSEMHDNFDFATGRPIKDYPDKRPA
jgi:hypothetical protein